MKILLLNPPPVDNIRYTREGRCQEKEDVLGSVKPPLTLLYIASIARKSDNEVVFLDANIKRHACKETQESIGRYNPDLIFISTSTQTIDFDFKAIPSDTNAQIIVIGSIAKALPEYAFSKHPKIKAIVDGDPEYVAMRIVEEKGFKNIDGIIIREKDRITRIPQKSELDLNDLPVPAWDMLDFNQYLLPTNGKSYAMIEISRGCPYNCNFCVTGMVHGKKVRYKNPKAVIEEVKQLKTNHGITNFYFLADSPFSDKRQITGFLKSLIAADLGISWMSNARLDTIDEETGSLLRQSGCWLLAVGIESGLDHVRNATDKNLKLEDIKKGLSILRKNKVKTLGFYMLGIVNESKESVNSTIELALQLDSEFANFYPAVPYPGTEFFSYCMKNGYLTSQDFSRYDYSDFVIDYGNGVNRNFIMAKKKEAYLRFYLRPKKLLELAAMMPIGSLLSCGIRITRR